MSIIQCAYSKAVTAVFEASRQKHLDSAKPKSKISEDAVVAAPAAGGGEIAAPTDVPSDIQAPDTGIKYDDVLGKCDHKHDGYLGPGCFHVPKRVGKLMRRVEILRKKKSHKNPYAAKMAIMTDAEVEAIESFPYEVAIDFLRNSYMPGKLRIHIDKIAYSAKEGALVFKARYVSKKPQLNHSYSYMLGTYDKPNFSTEKFKNIGMMSKEQAKQMLHDDVLTVIWKCKERI